MNGFPKKIIFFISLVLMPFIGKATCDSCAYYSNIFKTDTNYCTGKISKSFKWLTKNCMVLNETTIEDVLNLMGEGTKFKFHKVSYARYNPEDAENANPWFDYYLEYRLSNFCDNNGNPIYFPSSSGILLFKNDVLIYVDGKSYG